MRISVIVPVHNEADNIVPLAREIRAVMEGSHDYEMIYVDDGSTDQTPQVLRSLKEEIASLRVVCHRKCCGQSAALLSGVREAVNPVIVTLDGDGQNDPCDIVPLLEVFSASAGHHGRTMVAGLRFRRQDTAWRRMSSKIANAVRGRLLQDETPDTGCGLKIFARDLYLCLPCFDHMHRFLPALVKRAGGEVISVKVNHRPRKRGHSHYGTLDRLWVGIIDLLGVIWLMKRNVAAQIERTDIDDE